MWLPPWSPFQALNARLFMPPLPQQQDSIAGLQEVAKVGSHPVAVANASSGRLLSVPVRSQWSPGARWVAHSREPRPLWGALPTSLGCPPEHGSGLFLC